MTDGKPVADCLICNIITGQIPSTKVRETELTYCFKDEHPQAPTHDLLVPRAHYTNAAELAANAPQLTAALLAEAREVAKAEGLDDDGYRIVFNTGSHAGQNAPHVHAHVLGGDPLGTFGS